MKKKDSKSHGLSKDSANSEKQELDTNVEREGQSDACPNPQVSVPEKQEQPSASSPPDSEKSRKKKGGRFLSFLKILFTLILLGAAGLGGFWGYTKIKPGGDAFKVISDLRTKISGFESKQEEISEIISDLKLKISGFESKQNKIIQSLNTIESELGQIAKSNETISEIPETLSSLDEKLILIDEAVSGIPETILESMEEKMSSTKEPLDADMELEIEAPQNNVKKEDFSITPEVVIPQKGEGAAPSINELEKFMKSLFVNMGQGLNWSIEKLKLAFNKIKNR